MIDFFVKKPVTTIMLILLLVVLGVVSFFNLNLEKTPKIDFPLVTVSLVYPGATPLEVETLVVNKVEESLSEISEVKKIMSRSYENVAVVFIEFLLSSDVNSKFIEVKDKVDSLLNKFPSGMKKPIVQKFDPFVQPVLDFVLASEVLDEKQLYDLADDVLKDEFLSVKGVANVEILGGRKRQINVSLDPQLMKENYITVKNVVGLISSKNKNVPGGEIENSKNKLNLKFVGEYDDLQQLAETSLITGNGDIIPLSAIAKIEDGFKKVENVARFNGKNSVTISVKKSSDSNAVKIADQLKKKLSKVKAKLPDKTSLDIATDNTTIVKKENSSTEKDILAGILLTVVILYLFTGNLRLTFIASLTIPTSIIAALFLMDKVDFSINFLTLLAIASSIGTLISNTIVIIENFWKYRRKGVDSFTSAVKGTKEVAVAIFASTGTNLVVFLPIAFMKGMVGKFMYSFGMTVIFVTLFSLVVSFCLTPMLCCYLLKNQKKISFVPLQKPVDFLVKKYEKLFKVFFKFPKTTVLAVLLCFVSLKFIMPYIPGGFLPKSDEDLLMIKAQTPQGSSLSYTLDTVKTVENRIKDIPEIKSFVSKIGVNGAENATIVLNLVSNEERVKKDTDIIKTLIPLLADIPDVDFSIIRGSVRGVDEGDITLNILGEDYDKMVALSNKMKEKMLETGYFSSVDSSYKDPKKEICFIPSQKTLLESGIRDVEVGSAIRSAIYGDDSNIYKENGKEYDILVKLDDQYIKNVEDVSNIHVITKKGLLPVTSLGEVTKKLSIPTIIHENKSRVIKLNGFIGKSNVNHIKKELIKSFKDIDLDGDSYYAFAGMDESQQEAGQEIVKAFLLAVILTYMLLAAILNSLSYPICIIISIVTSFIGVFYALFFFESSINVISMLAMVMLVGLVVNNSILLVDSILQKKRDPEFKNLCLKEIIWLAAKERFQMIFMTSLAIVLGMVPQLGANMESKSSMGVVMLGGMLASIIFTFILTPISFYYTEKIKNFFRKKTSL